MSTYTDSEMLEWFAQSGACMAFSKDGDVCWLHWPYGKELGDDDDGRAVNQPHSFNSIREAILAAMVKS